MNRTVRHREEVLAPPTGPVDVLARRIPVGTKALPRQLALNLPPPDAPPKPVGKRAIPKVRAKPMTSQSTTRKTPRPWKPKERK
jgi:putative transposase